jgi:hypothetical protein
VGNYQIPVFYGILPCIKNQASQRGMLHRQPPKIPAPMRKEICGPANKTGKGFGMKDGKGMSRS